MTPSGLPALDAFDDLERQYNPRVAVAEAPAILAAWEARAAAARAARAPETLAYGPGPRETIEFYRAEAERGALAFIHGGYFRSLSTRQFSWLAAPWLARGVSVGLIEYPLCPEVSVADIVGSTRRGLTRFAAALDPATPLALAGHSAGGYLVAAMLAEPPDPAPNLAGALSLSGVFDLSPLIKTSINADIRLTPETAAALDLLRRSPALAAPLTLAVGAGEPEAFHRQSDALASVWADLSPERLDQGTNHFDIVDALADPQSAIARRVAGWLGVQAR
ncbi:MAG: alpha/beta hydrolase [Methylobacteriaceae bacterium]|nr:alpha/beta hydrolase [Methylobacteriaceae bacterium]